MLSTIGKLELLGWQSKLQLIAPRWDQPPVVRMCLCVEMTAYSMFVSLNKTCTKNPNLNLMLYLQYHLTPYLYPAPSLLALLLEQRELCLPAIHARKR